MRILYISHTHPPGGAILKNAGGMQRVSRQLVDELKTIDGIEVQTGTANVFGRGLVALKTTHFLVKSLLNLPSKARYGAADVILFSSMVTASLAWALRSSIDLPMITITHGRDVTLDVGIYQKLVPRIFRALDGVISVSSATRKECIRRGMKPEKGVVLPNGFQRDTITRLPQKTEARKALQTAFDLPLDDAFMLLTVGRKVMRKGHEWFIRKVLPKIDKKVVYVTVGDGPQFASIKESVNDTGQQKTAFLLGRQPDDVLQQAYAAADLFIMPNIPVEGDMEGFGIVLLEANMAQTPAVASDLEGITDVITTGKNGYKIAVLDAEKFAAKINELLATDLKVLSSHAREHVIQNFSWQHVARQYVSYLKQVVKRYDANRSKK